MELNIIWCHGAQAGPWGAKSKALAEAASEAGFTLDAIDFQDIDTPDDRIERLVDRIRADKRPAVIAGSSMGGYIATATARLAPIHGLFLVAPAFYLPGYETHVFTDLPEAVTVVHGWNDDVVPVDNSIRFAKLHKAALHILDDDHRMSNNVAAVRSLFEQFLKPFSDA